MSLRLFFDTTDEGKPVTNYTDQLLSLMEIDTSLPGSDENTNNARPPWVQFHWGSMHSFKAVVASVSVELHLFLQPGRAPSGRRRPHSHPVRGRQGLRRSKPDVGHARTPTASHRVQPGETLDRIAATYYGNPTQWRPIADLNGIEDPMALRPGRILVPIPTERFT